LRVALLATIALLAFSANSVLGRLALGAGDMNATGYTGVRIVSGALTLAAILFLRRQSDVRIRIGGSWRAAAALFGYAMAFSIAYLMLGAGTGALILFASVQIGMLAWAILKGDRPGLLEWLGFGVAFTAVAFLVAPALAPPPLLGSALMAAAGLSWAVYSLLGQNSRAPLADTTGNFIRCLPIALLLVASSDLANTSSPSSLAYAIASGAIASGMGYAIWYAVLPSMTPTSAAFVQLTVPAIAAVGGVLFIGEPPTWRLAGSSAGILGGVALAILAANKRRAKMPQGD
jgi:drug/metabolite transporter (DMT)-like permease